MEKGLTLSKTQTEGKAVDADQLTDDEWRISSRKALKGFTRLDARYFIPFFTRKFTRQHEVILEGVEEQISQQRCAVSAHRYANNLPKNCVSEADVDIVDKKVNSEAQFPTGEEVRNAHEEMQRLTSQLYSEVHSDLASDEEEAESKL